MLFPVGEVVVVVVAGVEVVLEGVVVVVADVDVVAGGVRVVLCSVAVIEMVVEFAGDVVV